MRPTKEIKIGEHTFKVKTYATPREMQPIRELYEGVQVEEQDGKKVVKGNSSTNQIESEKAMIEALVISVNDNAGDVYEWAQDNMDFQQYAKLLTVLAEIIGGEKKA